MMQFRTLPLVKDYFDEGAEPSVTNETWPALTLLLGGAVAAALPSIQAVEKLARSWPSAYRLVMLTLPLLVVVISVYFIVSRQAISDDSPLILTPTQDRERQRYSYSFRRRLVAKIMVPVSAIGLLGAFNTFAPNSLLLRRDLFGYICRAESGAAVEVGTVSAMSSAEELAGYAPAGIDDTGYFVLALSPWAARPARIIVRAPFCKSEISIVALNGRHTQKGCPAETRSIPMRRRGATYWLAACTS